MRKITLAVLIVGSLFAGHVLTRTLERADSWSVGAEQSLLEPASADSLLVKAHTGWPADMERLPLSEVGPWMVECDGSEIPYRGSLGFAVDKAHDMGCKSWEVSRGS